ncbi:MAG: type II secretion system protein [Planctomycetota bacterium]
MKKRGFTLIEMLVVISIISILAAILMPAIASVRRSARLASSSALIRTMSIALEHYGSDFSGCYPPDTIDHLNRPGTRLDGVAIANGAQALCYYIETQFISDDGRKSGAYENFKVANKQKKNDTAYTRTVANPPGSPIPLTMHYNFIIDAFGSPCLYDERKSERDIDGLNPESFVIAAGGAFDKNKAVKATDLDPGTFADFLPAQLTNMDTIKATTYRDTTPVPSATNDDIYNN